MLAQRKLPDPNRAIVHRRGRPAEGENGTGRIFPAQLQGASIDKDGHLTPGAPDVLAVENGMIALELGTGSAALVTVAASKGSGPRCGK